MPVGFLAFGILAAAVAGFALNYTIPTVGGTANALLSLTAWGVIGFAGAHALSLLVATVARAVQRVLGAGAAAGQTVAAGVSGDDGSDSSFAAGRREVEREVETETSAPPDADSPDDEATAGASLDPADYTVAELRDALATVDSEAVLRGVLAAEREGKDRKTGKEAIRRRLRQIGADPDATPTAGGGADADAGADATTDKDAGTPATDTGVGGRSTDRDRVPTDADIAFEDLDRGERIGSGGNAEVYRATWHGPDGDREVALKTPNLPGEETVDASFFERFDEEADTWARLDDHPYVDGVLDWGLDPHPWLALELLEGGNLAGRTPLPPGEAAGVVFDVADAVRHAHDRGVVHNDLKPPNVLFTADGVPKVGDWGLAKVLLDHSMTSSDGLSPAYAAPEQFDDGDRDAAALRRVDVYQLGALAHAALTGGPPFEGSTFEVLEAVKNEQPVPPSEVVDGVPPAVDEAVLTAMAKDPADRQPTVVHFVEAFESASEAVEPERSA